MHAMAEDGLVVVTGDGRQVKVTATVDAVQDHIAASLGIDSNAIFCLMIPSRASVEIDYLDGPEFVELSRSCQAFAL